GILLQGGDGRRVLWLGRFEPRNGRLRGSDPLGDLGLGQPGFGPSAQHFVEERKLVGGRVVCRSHARARKCASLELFEAAGHVTSFIRRRAISSSLGGVFSDFFTNW